MQESRRAETSRRGIVLEKLENSKMVNRRAIGRHKKNVAKEETSPSRFRVSLARRQSRFLPLLFLQQHTIKPLLAHERVIDV